MTTITLWLLVSIGHATRPETSVVERFASAAECQRVLLLIRQTSAPALRCIEATIAKP